MKAKSLVVLLLAGIWGVGSWWWYTCKVKGFCGADTTAAQVTSGAASLAGAASSALDSTVKAPSEADKAAADAQAKAEADKAAAEAQAKADADKAAADAQAKADADKAAADAQAKADADKATADAGKITMETNSAVPDTGTGIEPALLHFPTGSANPQLADETKAYFEKVAKFLNDNASGKVTVVGHTDNQGKADKNKALGMQRADAIKQMLVKMGAPAERISSSSEGQDKPVADNKTEEGRKKNRRVEITPAK
jgi:outer membrane protein OmpA-like peptidoglycan-associated protein